MGDLPLIAAHLTPIPRNPNDRLPATIRQPRGVWGEGEEGEPDGIALDFDNIEALMASPQQAGFELLDIRLPGGIGHSRYVVRCIRFHDQSEFAILDDSQITRAICALEDRGFTFNFAFFDEDEIDSDWTYRFFAKVLRGQYVPEAELSIRAA